MRNILAAMMMLMLLSACQQKKAELTNLDLSSMADVPETVTIIIKNYKPQSGNSYQNLFVSNYSVTAHHGQLEWSSARDGLSDDLKSETFNLFGFTSDNSESAVIGFADFVLYKAGINLTNYSQLSCSASKMASTSNDMIIYNDDRNGGAQRVLGLRDCEKSYISLNPNMFDNNNNSIPDYLELRCGMNPVDPYEAYVSAFGDSVNNLEKCKMHIPLDEDADSQPAQLLGYRYTQSANAADGSKSFTVSNIPILKHGDQNFIAIYFTEVNDTTGETSLYTAYAILKDGYNGHTLEIDYWATSPANFFNQQIVVPDISN